MSGEILSKSSLAFSILCMVLTILYAAFAVLVFTFSDNLLAENEDDIREEVRAFLFLIDHC